MSAEEAIDGIDRANVEAWFDANVEGAEPPLSFELIAGGRSNLTYGVADSGGRRWALRRPPIGKTLGSAHDMGRETKVVSALSETRVPVAPIAGYCTDETVNEAPFYVMDFVEGPILRMRSDADPYDEEQRRQIGLNVIDTLVDIHSLDPDAVGLGDLGKKEDYVARTLRRW
jgi:aminoglycoside phosphotransferase (APT) family kinase protein